MSAMAWFGLKLPLFWLKTVAPVRATRKDEGNGNPRQRRAEGLTASDTHL